MPTVASAWPEIVLSFVFPEEIAERVPEDCPVFGFLGVETQRFAEKHKAIFEAKRRRGSRFLDSTDWAASRFSWSISPCTAATKSVPIFRALFLGPADGSTSAIHTLDGKPASKQIALPQRVLTGM